MMSHFYFYTHFWLTRKVVSLQMFQHSHTEATLQVLWMSMVCTCTLWTMSVHSGVHPCNSQHINFEKFPICTGTCIQKTQNTGMAETAGAKKNWELRAGISKLGAHALKTGTHMVALVSYVPRLKNRQRWSNTILEKTFKQRPKELLRVREYTSTGGQIVLEVYLPILL